MKKIIIIIAVVFISITANSQIISSSLQASGLTCSMCNLSIKKSLEKLPFIKEVKPNIETATYQIIFNDTANIVLYDMQKAVKKAGFSVARLFFTANLNNVSINGTNSFTINGISYYIVNATSKTLNGNIQFQIIDKGFTADKDFAKHKLKLKASADNTIINVIQL